MLIDCGRARRNRFERLWHCVSVCAAQNGSLFRLPSIYCCAWKNVWKSTHSFDDLGKNCRFVYFHFSHFVFLCALLFSPALLSLSMRSANRKSLLSKLTIVVVSSILFISFFLSLSLRMVFDHASVNGTTTETHRVYNMRVIINCAAQWMETNKMESASYLLVECKRSVTMPPSHKCPNLLNRRHFSTHFIPFRAAFIYFFAGPCAPSLAHWHSDVLSGWWGVRANCFCVTCAK